MLTVDCGRGLCGSPLSRTAAAPPVCRQCAQLAHAPSCGGDAHPCGEARPRGSAVRCAATAGDVRGQDAAQSLPLRRRRLMPQRRSQQIGQQDQNAAAGAGSYPDPARQDRPPPSPRRQLRQTWQAEGTCGGQPQRQEQTRQQLRRPPNACTPSLQQHSRSASPRERHPPSPQRQPRQTPDSPRPKVSEPEMLGDRFPFPAAADVSGRQRPQIRDLLVVVEGSSDRAAVQQAVDCQVSRYMRGTVGCPALVHCGAACYRSSTVLHRLAPIASDSACASRDFAAASLNFKRPVLAAFPRCWCWGAPPS